MRYLLYLLFILFNLNSSAQKSFLLVPKHILYHRISNKVYVNCSKEIEKNLSFRCKDTSVKLSVIKGSDGAIFIKPYIKRWRWICDDCKKDTYIYLVDSISNKIADSISVEIMSFPNPEFKLAHFKRIDRYAKIQLDSIEMKSDFFDELGIMAKIDSFSICLGVPNPHYDVSMGDSTIFFKTNYGSSFNPSIKEQLSSLISNLTSNASIRFEPVYYSIDKERFKLESGKLNKLYFFLNNKQ